MAKRVERIGKYFYITDTISGVKIVDDKTQDVQFKEIDGIYSFDVENRYKVSYKFSELVDSNDIAWTDIATLSNYLRINTGAQVTIDAVLQDSTSPLMMVRASKIVAETTTTAILAKDDYVINVADATGFLVGQYLTIYNANSNRVFFSYILSINALAITLDTPLDFEYPIGSFVSVADTNMNVNGSVTPQIFGIRNPTAVDIPLSFDITRLMFHCTNKCLY